MTDSEPGRLRIFHQAAELTSVPASGPVTEIEVACGQFRTATGWPLRLVSRRQLDAMREPLWSAPFATDSDDERWLVIEQAPSEPSPSGALAARGEENSRTESAIALATTLCRLYRELARERRTVAAREAELAAGVPLVVREDEGSELAERLSGVLRGGAEGVGCHAAGLYMLDAATTELKLRSCWGIPSERLLEPARALQGELGDLEALTGSAVVLDSKSLMTMWKAPEAVDYASAVCVPVASNMSILGTLWFFCQDERGFDDRETNLIEIIAGRLAVELEREMLLCETAQEAGFNRSPEINCPPELNGSTASNESTPFNRSMGAEETNRLGLLAEEEIAKQKELSTVQEVPISLAPVSPKLETLDIAAKTHLGKAGAVLFHDWLTLPTGQIAMTLGHARHDSASRTLAAQSLRSALRAHGQHLADPGELLQKASETLWQASAGDPWASGAVAVLDDSSHELQYASAGEIQALIIGNTMGDWRPLVSGIPLLGVSPESRWKTEQAMLRAGEVLVLLTLAGVDPSQIDLMNEHLATSLGARSCANASELLETAERVLASWRVAGHASAGEQSLLVARRR